MRKYPWGTCEALSSTHSDVGALKRLLFEDGYEELKSETNKRYFTYRSEQLLDDPSLWVHHPMLYILPARPRSSWILSAHETTKSDVGCHHVCCLAFAWYTQGYIYPEYVCMSFCMQLCLATLHPVLLDNSNNRRPQCATKTGHRIASFRSEWTPAGP